MRRAYFAWACSAVFAMAKYTSSFCYTSGMEINPSADSLTPEQEQEITERIERERERRAVRYQANRQEIIAKATARIRANPEPHRERVRQYGRIRVGLPKDPEERKKVLAARRHEKYLAKREAAIQRAKENYALNKRIIRDRLLRTRFGIGLLAFEATVVEQGGGCALCGAIRDGKSKASLAVDHDHRTGEGRGVLCSYCNRSLSLIEDAEWRDKADAYLADPPMRRLQREGRLTDEALGGPDSNRSAAGRKGAAARWRNRQAPDAPS